jgi:hypothetical protein
MGVLARAPDELSRPDADEADIAYADEPTRLAQVGRRHVDAAAAHAGDEIAAAGDDRDRRSVLEQRQVAP